RRTHAQDLGHRHRRPTPAPRPRLPDQRRQRPTHPGTLRPGGEPVELTNLAGGGPPILGRSHGHHRAHLVTVSGQVSCPPLGSSYWPLTSDRGHARVSEPPVGAPAPCAPRFPTAARRRGARDALGHRPVIVVAFRGARILGP